jgi:hypothetical protein
VAERCWRRARVALLVWLTKRWWERLEWVVVWWWWWWKLNKMPDMEWSFAWSVAVAHSGSFCRLSVRTGVYQCHMLEHERECIRGGWGVLGALTRGYVLTVVIGVSMWPWWEWFRCRRMRWRWP